jgi:hypothetical protein
VKPLKEARLSIRFPLGLKEKLDNIEKETGVIPTILAVEGLSAICKYYETKGALMMPFAVIPKLELDTILARLPDKKKAAANNR